MLCKILHFNFATDNVCLFQSSVLPRAARLRLASNGSSSHHISLTGYNYLDGMYSQRVDVSHFPTLVPDMADLLGIGASA